MRILFTVQMCEKTMCMVGVDTHIIRKNLSIVWEISVKNSSKAAKDTA